MLNEPPAISRRARLLVSFSEQTINAAEKDVLVVGDYNMVPGQDAQNFNNLSPGPANNEFLRFISAGLSPSHIGRCINASQFQGNLLDGFAISRKFTTRVDRLHACPAIASAVAGHVLPAISEHGVRSSAVDCAFSRIFGR